MTTLGAGVRDSVLKARLALSIILVISAASTSSAREFADVIREGVT
jgi:hypothetical protein